MTAAGGMGVTALGSAMKGIATYEDSVLAKGHNWSDSGSIGAGVVQATSTFFVNAIPLLPKFGAAGVGNEISKPVLMLITAPVNAFSTFAVGVTKGDSLGKSLINTIISTGLSAVPLGDAIDKLALPIAVKYSMPTLQKAVSAGVQSAVGVALDRAQSAVVDRLTKPHKPHVSHQLAKLIGVPGTPASPRTNKEYVSDEVMCLA